MDVKLRKQMPVSALLDPKIVAPAIGSALIKLNPLTLMTNPVMFVLEMVTTLTTVILVRDILIHAAGIGFEFQIVLWLWFTVLFANFAEAVAEGRGKAQAESLRRTRTETQAKLLSGVGTKNYKLVPGNGLKVGDLVLVEAGDIVELAEDLQLAPQPSLRRSRQRCARCSRDCGRRRRAGPRRAGSPS